MWKPYKLFRQLIDLHCIHFIWKKIVSLNQSLINPDMTKVGKSHNFGALIIIERFSQKLCAHRLVGHSSAQFGNPQL